MPDPHQNAVKQLEAVAQLLASEYTDQDRFLQAVDELKQPENLIAGEVEVKMDDGSHQTFKAYRSQHSSARGPYKGGIRFHPQVSESEVKALSTWMSWKCAVTGIPYGGGKGGIVVDPRQLSAAELQRLSRGYVRMIADQIGPWQDVPAPDVNTNGQIMAWMADEYQAYLGQNQRLQQNPLAAFTGKPLGLGGSEGRTEATGLGGVYILDELAAQLNWNKAEKTIAIQGFGNVGYWFAVHAVKSGYKLVAVSDSQGGIVNFEQGLDPEEILQIKQTEGTVTAGNFNKIKNEDLLMLDVDVLVPAALENAINRTNADMIQAEVIIEMANGPVTPQADQILEKRKVAVIPDILANAGGVTVSYFEWVQNLQGFTWDKDRVLGELKPLMIQAFTQMWRLKQQHQISPRMATYLFAVKRVVDAMLLRGWV